MKNPLMKLNWLAGLIISAPLFLSSTCEDDEPLVPTAQVVQDYITAGTWQVTYFFDDTDETSHFTGYDFTFQDNGSLQATNGSNAVEGTWSTSSSDSGLKLIIDFGVAVPFDELNDDWKIKESTSVKIKLEDVSGGSGEVDYLTFEKN